MTNEHTTRRLHDNSAHTHSNVQAESDKQLSFGGYICNFSFRRRSIKKDKEIAQPCH